jgi:type IV fimbrial biogenesis protein FimT
MQVFAAPAARRHQRGLTLIETMAALAVVGVLVGSAVPAFDKFQQRRVLDGVAAEALSDLHYARAEAVSRNRTVRFSVIDGAGDGRCTVIHAGALGGCVCTSSGAQCAAGAELIKSNWFASATPVSLSSNVGSMVIDPVRGTFSPAGKLRVALNDGTEIHHIVTPAGRIRSCSPSGAAKGYPVC